LFCLDSQKHERYVIVTLVSHCGNGPSSDMRTTITVGFTTGHQFSITGNLGHLFPGNP